MKTFTTSREEENILEKAGDILTAIQRKIILYECDHCESEDCLTLDFEEITNAIEVLDFFCVHPTYSIEA